MNKLQTLKIVPVGLVLLAAIFAAAPAFPARLTPAVRISPTPTPSPVAATTQSVQDLVARIRSRLVRPELRRGSVGIKVTSLASGRTVFEENAERYFMPASNMKNFTVATAMEKLTPDFRFVTSVYAAAMPGSGGTVKGDVRIYGRGDVSISTAFSDGNYYKGLDDLADKIVQAGVRKIDGDLVGDDSYFIGDALPATWEWDDLQWYYGAEVSALPLNDNAFDLTVAPGVSGYGCVAKVSPLNLIVRVVNQCTTTAAGTKRDLKIVKRLNENIIEISGSLPVGDSGFSGSVTFTRPAELFVALLKERLALKGVTVTGRTRVLASRPSATAPAQVEIARLESPPFSVIAGKTMKPSQNMYTETILRALGERMRADLAQKPSVAGVKDETAPRESMELGLTAVRNFLSQIGVAPDSVMQYDGSGLSRHDLVTPAAVVAVYTYMAKQSRYSQAWRDALTIAGVDGTLKNRFAGTKASGNLRGKTGTIDQVSALSGYMTTAGGEQLIVSIIVNGVAEGRSRTSLIDDIVVNLANFDGKIE
ncbi:MAG TPA: D-alanyl-D-alanine carboxypeptidase/D-alanyl-D-alanine-endopeptidase [Pyrinomonadaceae bacterium]|nr:D-alanyl-D-alanine carboxypeptidase/D-alanyl-D-alanine-endopeptidase [Pyrinomonadaceae bacterium]